MTAILFDLDGVLYDGDEPIEGAPETVEWVQDQNIPHLFLTNTTSRPRSALVKKLARFGIQAEVSRILTPAVAAARWLRENIEGSVALFVPDATRVEFKELALLDEKAEDGASAVVIGDLGDAWDFAALNRAFRMLVSEPKPRLIALGMTRYWRAPDGLRLDTAPFVVALEHASDIKAQVFGKPAMPFFQTALDLMNETASNTIMVGDDIFGDIEGAQKLGLKGVLVRTGKFQEKDLKKGITPVAVIDSVASLPKLFEDINES
jgi:HAD superfamily hydrolase (TIGR01458 family)